MIPYLIKVVLCSSLLYLFYFLTLEKEKFHTFNRFYLLGSIIASFIIPLIKIKTQTQIISRIETINLSNYNLFTSVPQQTTVQTSSFDILSYLVLSIYALITGFLLIRFIRNIIQLFSRIKKNKRVEYSGAKLILIPDKVIPFSFLRYVFVNNENFEKGTLEKELLYHELTHIKQMHSLDILAIEMLTIFIWFNPIIYFYRKSIQLNHEFLADDSVVKTFNNSKSYQYLLLNKTSYSNSIQLTSPFNYLITKKRIIMMTKRTSIKVSAIKIFALIPLLVTVIFLFSTRVNAQNNEQKVENENHQQIGSTKDGVSKELLDEYKSIIEKYRSKEEHWSIEFAKSIASGDRERLETIYQLMSKEQQDKQKVFFEMVFIPKPTMPTKEQFESFKDDKKYGVWIDGKKVENKELNNFKNVDFRHLFISQLMKNAINYGKYDYQVDLETSPYYEKSIEQIKNIKTIMLIRNLPN